MEINQMTNNTHLLAIPDKKLCMTCFDPATECVIVLVYGTQRIVTYRTLNYQCKPCLLLRQEPHHDPFMLFGCYCCGHDFKKGDIIYHHYTRDNKYYVMCPDCKSTDNLYHWTRELNKCYI